VSASASISEATGIDMPITEGLRRVFGAHANRAPTHGLRVPGRLEVLGKHTDYAGGRALVAALPRGFVFLGAPRSDTEVIVADARHDLVFRLGEPSAPHSRAGAQYLHAVVGRLSRNFPGSRSGVTIAFASDLPRASGMSSSSALLTGLTLMLARLWDLESRDEWRAAIATPDDLATYCASVENGRTFGALDGDHGVGTQGGSEDHAAILLARADHLSMFEFVPLRRVRDVRFPAAWRFVIATSGIAASKSGAVREVYNRLSGAIAELQRLWSTYEGPCASLAAALSADATAGDRLRALIHRHPVQGWTSDALERRLAHFEIETALVGDAVTAIERTDTLALGQIADASQLRAERLLGNQTPETAALARAARETGAFAASSFGAGFGGAVWALVEAGSAEEFAQYWLASYRQECAVGQRAEVFIASPGPALEPLDARMLEGR
jgi:galactokinase